MMGACLGDNLDFVEPVRGKPSATASPYQETTSLHQCCWVQVGMGDWAHPGPESPSLCPSLVRRWGLPLGCWLLVCDASQDVEKTPFAVPESVEFKVICFLTSWTVLARAGPQAVQR